MRFVVLDPLEPNRFARFIDDDFDFRHVQIERAVLKSFCSQQGRQFPCRVQMLAKLIAGRIFQDAIRFLVSQSFRAANDSSRETRAAGSPHLVELQEDGLR